ncbi:winged helix-turn-helix transcriptional regulator [Thermogymnomonas acidicola]|uniref:Lrp/AsnC family transcriptional regulator n=1 Tax=Thermogymnomonas acidicola TaxID=399579 RepID=UPI00094611A8|nr:winged helix-turn-helix transcriptional regulator [Thermogymnomonas acidicola]
MDEIDRRIIRRLQWPNSDTEFSFSDFAVSRSTGVSVQTVRKRIARMVENGILKGNYLMPMPSLFGLSSGTLCAVTVRKLRRGPGIT